MSPSSVPTCRAVCRRADGSPMTNVHVGVQLRQEPAELTRADVPRPAGISRSTSWNATASSTSAAQPSTAGVVDRSSHHVGRGGLGQRVRDVPPGQADARSDRRQRRGGGAGHYWSRGQGRPDRRRRRSALCEGRSPCHHMVRPSVVAMTCPRTPGQCGSRQRSRSTRSLDECSEVGLDQQVVPTFIAASREVGLAAVAVDRLVQCARGDLTEPCARYVVRSGHLSNAEVDVRGPLQRVGESRRGEPCGVARRPGQCLMTPGSIRVTEGRAGSSGGSTSGVCTWVCEARPMRYRRLGRTALQVSELCLGTMNFGPQTPEDESFAIMDRARRAGDQLLRHRQRLRR